MRGVFARFATGQRKSVSDASTLTASCKGGVPMALDLTQRMPHGLPSVLAVEAERRQTFGLLVREYRKAQGWSQAMLSEQWGYSFETISAWERGKRFPGRLEVSRLAQMLEVDAQELVRIIHVSKPKQGDEEKREHAVSVSRKEVGPFGQGRLLWTLHVGMERGQLHCVIACPLASGEVWEVPFDPVRDGEAIQQVYQVIHEQVSKVAGGPQTQAGGKA